MALDTNKPNTLADVLALLNADACTGPNEHRDQTSAIPRISEMLHRSPGDLPAGVTQLRPLISKLHAVQCGVSSKTLSNIKSNLTSALKSAGVIPAEHEPIDRTDAWNAFLNSAPSDHQRWGLARFADFCCAHQIAPENVDEAVFERFFKYLDERLLARSPRDVCKVSVETWNYLIAVNKLPFSRVAWGAKRRFKARRLSDYPQSLQDEIASYISRLEHSDLFDEEGPDKPLRPTSIRNIEAHIRQHLDALVSDSMPIEDMQSLKDVVTPETAKRAFNSMLRRRGSNAIPPGFANIAATLTAIARHHLKVPEPEVQQFITIKKRLATNPRGMSTKNKERLGQFEDWQNVIRVATLAHVLMDRANEDPTSRESALAAMHAATLGVLLSCPMRAQNVSSLDLDRHLRPQGHGAALRYGIRVEGSEVKNGEPVEVKLNAKMSRLLDRYIVQFRPMLTEHESTALFPRRSDGRPRKPSNFSAHLKEVIERETGLVMHMHLFRHFAAYLYLKERPENFELVRRLLKHKRLQTTMDFYASLSNQWAHDHYDQVVLSKIGGSDD
ncbi:site-specific integrase [Roseivivax sp. GX 12232]|uniref:site-specific integrase n=1 Tax=Roseivivax sp. GX 12232 TaxID=2900547 RepID=UPI001E2DACD3|nr:site-specific integrase [Roseivivax sp. GX 12232]MCE0505389.1 site-specific integrase [Roseivivax sp. GX 12232]